MRKSLSLVFSAALLASSCARRPVLLDASALLGTVTPPALTSGLRVTCWFDEGATDPLPIDGTGASFVGLRKTLADVSGAALNRWAEKSHRSGGWELQLELYEASAKTKADRTTVSLAVRATLTGGAGELYAAQTREYCKEEANDAPAAVYACMASLTHDLERWIEGVPP